MTPVGRAAAVVVAVVVPLGVAAGCGTGRDLPGSPLHVATVTPADGQFSVAANTSIVVTFTVEVDPRTIEGTGRLLLVDGRGVPQQGASERSSHRACPASACELDPRSCQGREGWPPRRHHEKLVTVPAR